MDIRLTKLETVMHSEMTKQTWMFIKWMTGLLVTLLPSLIAATFYIARYIN